MSLYLIVFCIIAVCFAVEIILQKRQLSDKIGRGLLIGTLILITTLLSFRYGEGSDYLSYEKIYNGYFEVSSFHGFLDTWRNGIISEVGFCFLLWILAMLHVPYTIFLAGLAILEAFLLYRFIDRYTKGGFRCFTLLMLYPSFIFIYEFSAMRQGLSMALFLGVLLPLLEQKKWIPYYIIAALCFLMHRTSLIYLVCPLAILFSTKLVEILTGIALAGGIVYTLVRYVTEGRLTISVSSFVLRIGICIVVIVSYHHIKAEEHFTWFYRIALGGMAAYFVFAQSPFWAARVSDTVRFIDVIIIVQFMKCLKKQVLFVVSLLLTLYAGGLLCKNLETRARSGMIDTIHAYNYPYFTIFQKEQVSDYLIKQ